MNNKPNKLDSLSNEELGKLFPIEIADPNPEWVDLFREEKERLTQILKESALRIEHFGSTAIPNIKAKPIIDILVEIPGEKTAKTRIINLMTSNSYHHILRKDCLPPYSMFVKGYTESGYRGQAYHIHMAEKEHDGLWDRLYFRDYLKIHGEVAREYEKLKDSLALKFKYDREAYTNGKTEFVQKITQIAKAHFNPL